MQPLIKSKSTSDLIVNNKETKINLPYILKINKKSNNGSVYNFIKENSMKNPLSRRKALYLQQEKDPKLA